jgi:hypothetical protein
MVYLDNLDDLFRRYFAHVPAGIQPRQFGIIVRKFA